MWGVTIMEKNDSRVTFSIGDTANMTGLTQKQIRNWEEKGYIPEAERVVSGEELIEGLRWTRLKPCD